ncbi:MAG: DNA-directed RNA polymerase subunit H [Candidatus Altiarchaeota archaeon]|nr:DNA-directed RNA polymerase subunit H [Candidatus Altiarchaeota archaeon]
MVLIDHVLVPLHEILSPEDKKEVLEKYNAVLDQFPKIFIDDPAIKDMKPQPGDLIKITRKNPEIGTSYYYRVVIQ